MSNINNYPPKSGRIIGEDNETRNIVDILSGDMPVSDKTHNINNYPAQSGRVIGEDGKAYNLVELLQNVGGGDPGNGGGGNVSWPLPGTPQKFPPTEHDHNDLYYTKEEAEDHVNFVRDLMEQEQGKVRLSENDQLSYLSQKVDGITIEIKDNELCAKTLEGLSVGTVELNTLEGIGSNVQSQINGLENILEGIAGGMKFRGIEESYSNLLNWTNIENGDVAVVITDETKDDGRSMYVYNDELAKWDYLGTFTFSTSFTALQDTPNDYQDGKYLKSTDNGIVYDDVDYQKLKNKPQATITQIDDAVEKRHEHVNKPALDRIGVNEQGQITIDGIPYVPANIEPPKKEYLYALLNSSQNHTVTQGAMIKWDISEGDIPYSPSTGLFTLKAGKHYRVQVNLVGLTSASQFFRIAMLDSNNNEVGGRALFSNTGVGPLVVHVIPDVTKDYKIVFVQVFASVPYIYNDSCSMDIIEL